MLSALPKKILERVSGHFMDPDKLLALVGVKPDQAVLEIGLPIGFFTHALLTQAVEATTVYTAGPTEESLEPLQHYNELSNFHPLVLAQVLSGKVIPPASLDLVILTNLLSNTAQPSDYCLPIQQYMKPAGLVLLVDWDPRTDAVAADDHQAVSREAAVKLMAGCGMEFVRVLDSPGYHYALLFRFASARDNLKTTKVTDREGKPS